MKRFSFSRWGESCETVANQHICIQPVAGSSQNSISHLPACQGMSFPGLWEIGPQMSLQFSWRQLSHFLLCKSHFLWRTQPERAKSNIPQVTPLCSACWALYSKSLPWQKLWFKPAAPTGTWQRPLVLFKDVILIVILQKEILEERKECFTQERESCWMEMLNSHQPSGGKRTS